MEAEVLKVKEIFILADYLLFIRTNVKFDQIAEDKLKKAIRGIFLGADVEAVIQAIDGRVTIDGEENEVKTPKKNKKKKS